MSRMRQDEITKIILWVVLGFSIFIALMTIAPYLSYVLIVVGIVIPAYLLYKRKKEEDD